MQALGTLPSPETQVYVWGVGWLPVSAYDLSHLREGQRPHLTA